VVTDLKVLGVTLTDPANSDGVTAAVKAGVARRVTVPIRLLIDEVVAGAGKGTALFLLRRFILPVLVYHQQCCGLHAAPDAWADVDAALDDFCMAVCPEDLRVGLGSSTLREELALPTSCGGLGIPRASREAPFRAAELWRREDAEKTHASPAVVARAYRRDDTNRWKAVTIDEAHAAAERALSAPLEAAARRRWMRRRELNKMKGAERCFDSVP